MKYCHYLFVALGITSAAILASCQDEDFGYTSDQIAYRTNFEKMYGSVKDIPTWDFSSYNLRQMGLAGGPKTALGRGLTRANGACNGPIDGASSGERSTILSNPTETKYYSVESNTINWLNHYLGEGVDHTDLGLPFKLVKPENNKDFLLIPIYQGHSGMSWDLHLVAKNQSDQLKDYKIWSKSDNIKYGMDFSRSGGEEYFYNTMSGNDVPERQDGDGFDNGYDAYGNTVKLKIGRAYQDFFDQISSWTSFKVHIIVPKGGKIKGHFGNVYNDADGWKFDFDNSSGSEARSFTMSLIDGEHDIRTLVGSETDPDDVRYKDWPSKTSGEYYNFGLKKLEYSGCSVNTFAPNRIHIFVEFTGGNTKKTIDLTGHTGFNDVTINRYGIQSIPMRINCSEIKDDFFFYLDVVNGDGESGNKLAETGARQRSDQGMMLALVDKTTDAYELIHSSSDLLKDVKAIVGDDAIASGATSCEYFVIGAEDADLKNSDWDINDVVFLVVGLDKAPKVKEIISKRYMIEDLGSTLDFDFNDIVVDVTQEGLKKVGETSYSSIKQTANLVHLCGTIPFQLKIGDTQFGKVNGNNGGCGEGGDGFNPATDPTTYSTYLNAEVEGWVPTRNNIEVTVWPNQAGATSYNGQANGLLEHPEGKTYSFPASGQFPYIIACDQSVNWMPENHTVPKNWFSTWPTSFDDWTHGTDNGQGGNNNQGQGGGSSSSIAGTTAATTVSAAKGTPVTGYTIDAPNQYCNVQAITFGIQTGGVKKVYFELPANSAFQGSLGGGYDNDNSNWKSQFFQLKNTSSSPQVFVVELNEDMQNVSQTSSSFKLDLQVMEDCNFTEGNSKCVMMYFENIIMYLPLSESLTAGWDSSYDPATKTITYEKSWTGRGWGWWGTPLDASSYSSVEVVYETATEDLGVQLVAQYNVQAKDSEGNPKTDSEGNPILEESVSGFVTGGKVTVALDPTFKLSRIKQIYIQSNKAGSITLTSACLK